MSRIRFADTKPEIRLCKTLFAEGFRYRKNVRTLSGKPDLVFPRYKAIVFINGCFWHGHENCSRSHLPSSNTDYWTQKIQRNKLRDKRNIGELEKQGWKVLTVWECDLNTKEKLKSATGSVAAWLKKDQDKTNRVGRVISPSLSHHLACRSAPRRFQ